MRINLLSRSNPQSLELTVECFHIKLETSCGSLDDFGLMFIQERDAIRNYLPGGLNLYNSRVS